MVDFLFQTFSDDGTEQFNSNRPPICYIGKVEVGANVGILATSQAFSQGGPNMSQPIENVRVAVPAGTIMVAVYGDKCPIQLTILNNEANFHGLRAGTCTLYCFGRYNKAPATSGWVFEIYNSDGTLAFDAETRFLLPVSGTSSGPIAVPAGRKWAGVLVGQGASDQFRTVGSKRYRSINLTGIDANAGSIQLKNVNRDVVAAPSGTGEEELGTIFRSAQLFAVDVTGY